MHSRRHFLAAGSAAFAASSFHIFGADPNKKYRTALIGSGWWGMNILREAIASQRIKVCALCDVHEDVASNAADDVNSINGDAPKIYKDYRDLLEKEKPEIVIIATPDHWHALQTIAACKAGARWDAAHLACQKRLTKGLVELGVLRGDAAALFTKGAFKKWYMHGTSHWLGRDVHDVGSYQSADGKPTKLRPGMVLTIEPGLYFGEKDAKVRVNLFR